MASLSPSTRRAVSLPLLCAIVFISFNSFTMTASAQTGAGGRIAGHVQNGSAGMAPVPATPVQLVVTTAAGSRQVGNTTTDADGGFTFDGVETSPSLHYSVSTSFAGVSYTGAPLTFAAGSSQTSDIVVFATTSSADTIAIDRLSIVVAAVDSRQGLLTIVESYRIKNSGRLTYVGTADAGRKRTLDLALFNGARDLTPFGGFTADDALPTPAGFSLATPIIPGDSAIAFTYQAPYRSPAIQLAHAVAYPTAAAEVILPEGMAITSPELTETNTVQLNGRSFAAIQAKNLVAGSQIHLTFSGLPPIRRSSTALDSLSSQMLVLGAGAMLALLILGGIRPLIRGRAERGLLERRAQLIAEVARLDDQAEQGLIDDAVYREQREQALVRLIALSGHRRDGGGSRPLADQV